VRLAGGEQRSALRQEARDLLHDVLDRYAEGRTSLQPDEAARLVLAVVDVPLRDEVCGMATGRYAAELRSLLHDLTRRALPPEDAPVVTTLAAVAYAQGDGVVAGIALDRALASDPDYSLARLLMRGLQSGADPSLLRQAFAPDARRARRTRTAKRSGRGRRRSPNG
jgi:hypothetical protein